MTDDKFKIEILDLHWIEGGDDPTDLCAHGHLYLKIGDKVVSDNDAGDWTLSSTALSLLRTIEKNYEKDVHSNKLLTHCESAFRADDKEETAAIKSFDNGIDWKIIHIDDDKIKHTFEDGYEVTIDKYIYRKNVLEFIDQVERFFKHSQPKTIPIGNIDRKGYLTFWKEWKNLRAKWK